MINFKRLNHLQICIPVGKEDEARKFYTEIIGLVEIPKPKELLQNGGFLYQVGDIHLHIGTENEISRSKRHPAFEIENLNDARDVLQKNNIKVKEEIQIPGQERFTFFDPFGNRIEFLVKT